MLAEFAWDKMFEMPQIAIVAGALIGCVVPTAGIIATFWYRAQKNRADSELKAGMIKRGLSVEDIERVLAAKSSDE